MVRRNSKLLVLGGTWLISVTTALQVVPGSPCASVCVDNIMDDPTNPDSSNTYASDISCVDNDYNTTSVGQKFQQCLSCLQTSSATSGNETDQGWFLYNLRFAVDSCLYGYPQPSTAIDSQCIGAGSCGAFEGALKYGDLNPDSSPYGYCTADNDEFSGSALNDCIQCVSSLSEEQYLANFLVALQAGCEQQPTTGTTIGLNETVFSSTLVAITTPLSATGAAGTGSGDSGLSTGAIIGIAIAGAAALLFAVAMAYVCFKKHQKRKRSIESRYNSRFGAKEISSPLPGAHISPQNSPPFKTALSATPLPIYEVKDPRGTAGEYYDRQAGRTQVPGAPQGTTIPSELPHHEAYIPLHTRTPSDLQGWVMSPTGSSISSPGVEKKSFVAKSLSRGSSRRKSPPIPSNIRVVSVNSSLPGFSQVSSAHSYGYGPSTGSATKTGFVSPALGSGGTVSSATSARSETWSPPYTGGTAATKYSQQRTPPADDLKHTAEFSHGPVQSEQTWGERMLGLGNRTMPGGAPGHVRREPYEEPITPIDDFSPISRRSVEQWPGSM